MTVKIDQTVKNTLNNIFASIFKNIAEKKVLVPLISIITVFAFVFFSAAFFSTVSAQNVLPSEEQTGRGKEKPPNKYSWLQTYEVKNSIAERISPPEGFVRSASPAGGFEDWLRGLPLKNGRPPVYLYNKKLKNNQGAHFAVVDIDCGTRDLQQCADAVMRLRAEYFFSKGDIESIKFDTGSARAVSLKGWLKRNAGAKSVSKSSDYNNFGKYMTHIFAYAGTHSLAGSLKKVSNPADIKTGDIFIKGGFPGHAVLVVDVAVNKKSGRKVFLLLQSYMPAQDMHILINPNDKNLSPWYDSDFGDTLETPEWNFTRGQLMRF